MWFGFLISVGGLQAQTAISVVCPSLQTVTGFKAGDHFVVSAYIGEDPNENNPGEGLSVVTAYDNGTVIQDDELLLIPATPENITDPPVVAGSSGTVKACFNGIDGDETPTVTYSPLPSLSGVTVAPANSSIATGGVQQFTAIGNFADGSALDLTRLVSWKSSAPGVAMVNAAGKATGLSIGSTSINASLGAAAGTASLTVTSTAPVPLSLSCTPGAGPITEGVPYIASCSATGGMPPYSWFINNGSLPAGLSLGTANGASVTIGGSAAVVGSYSYAVQVTDSSEPAKNASQAYQGTVGTPSLTVSPGSLTFNTQIGAVAPSQQITVSSASVGSTYVATAGPRCAWLSLSGPSVSMDGTITLSADAGRVSGAGVYNCSVSIISATGSQVQDVFVTFVVTGIDLRAAPGSLDFSYSKVDGPPAPQGFAIHGNGADAVNFSAAAGCSWVTLGSTTGTTPGMISVSVSAENLAIGSYTCPVTISSTIGAKIPPVMVNLLVSSAPAASPQQLLFTAVRGSTTPVVRTFGVSGPAAALAFTGNAAADNGGNWLSIDALSGTTPADVVVRADPSQLAPGTYHGTVTVTFTDGQTSPVSVDVGLVVSDVTITAVPGALGFRFQQSGTAPAAQIVSMVTSDGSAARFTASASGSITVTPGPGAQNVTIAPSGTLTAGTYSGSVTLTASTGSPAQQSVPVTIVVDPPALTTPVLSTSTSGLTFSFSQGAATGSQLFIVGNKGGGSLNISSAAGTYSGGGWLSIDCAQTKVTPASPASCTVTADPSQVIPDETGSVGGTYSGAVTIATDTAGQSAVIPVTMTLTRLPLIRLSRNGLSFGVLEGGNARPAETIEVYNDGPGALNWSVQASPAWLKTSTNSGGLEVSVDPTMLPAGSPAGAYYGSLVIAASDPATGQPAANSPRVVTVVMNAVLSGSGLSPEPVPSGLVFSAAAGTANVPGQGISLYGPSGTTLAYSTAVITDDGGLWCSASPAIGNLGKTGTVTVQVDFTNSKFVAGSSHDCKLRFLFGDGGGETVDVTALVNAPAAACTASSWIVRVNRPQEGATVAAYLPAAWEVSVTDSCTGQPVSSIDNLSLFFSNGDVPAQVMNRSSANGIYTGSWTPTFGAVNLAESAVQVFAMARGQGLSGASTAVSVHVAQELKDVPQVTGVVNSASYAPASQAAPCSWVSVFGSHLAGTTSVSLAQAPLPLEYVSDAQVNAQVPCSLPADAPQDLVVDTGVAQSTSQEVIYASAVPAIFTTDQSGSGQAAVFWTTDSGDHVPADQNHPVSPGTVVEIYGTGLGVTSPAVMEGTPAPVPAPRVMQAVSVTIGNLPAVVRFAGLSPGAVGLYQVNAVVPAGVTAGPFVPIGISVGNRLSQPGTTIATTQPGSR
jgi:uncharacterized protein (TIGR03437 family)